MLNNKTIMYNKKSQLGETLTWVVATLIIVVTLIFFIFLSSSLAKLKDIKGNPGFALLGSYNKQSDWLSVKVNLAFAKDNKNEDAIKEWINEES